MNDPPPLLAAIANQLNKLGAEIVSSVFLQDNVLFACDQSLRIQVQSDQHSPEPTLSHYHVVSQVGSDTSSNLNACVIGLGQTEQERISDAANMWMSLMAGPVLTLLNRTPLLDALPFAEDSTHGVDGSHGAVGPRMIRDYGGALESNWFEGINLFENVSAMAPPQALQLAKVTLQAKHGQWTRHLEINGHQHTWTQDHWKCDKAAPSLATVTQFALFHFAENPAWLDQRRLIDQGIASFVKHFSESQNIESSLAELKTSGFPDEMIQQVHGFSSLAFSRHLFGDFGARYSNDYFHVLSDGSIQSKPLMEEPVFARSLMLSAGFQSGAFSQAFQNIALLNTEFNRLNETMNEGREPDSIELAPPVFVEAGISQDLLDRATRKILKQSARVDP